MVTPVPRHHLGLDHHAPKLLETIAGMPHADSSSDAKSISPVKLSEEEINALPAECDSENVSDGGRQHAHEPMAALETRLPVTSAETPRRLRSDLASRGQRMGLAGFRSSSSPRKGRVSNGSPTPVTINNIRADQWVVDHSSHGGGRRMNKYRSSQDVDRKSSSKENDRSQPPVQKPSHKPRVLDPMLSPLREVKAFASPSTLESPAKRHKIDDSPEREFGIPGSSVRSSKPSSSTTSSPERPAFRVLGSPAATGDELPFLDLSANRGDFAPPPVSVSTTLHISQEYFNEADASADSACASSSPDSRQLKDDRCPLCGKAIPPDVLKSFNNGDRMNIRQQAAFCRFHSRKAAQEAYDSAGYPIIDWDKLDDRITDQHEFVQSILDNQASSFYRNVLSDDVKSGKGRTLKQSLFDTSSAEKSLIPGYYGSRGLKVISENLMDRFSGVLRKVAITDRLVSSRGVTGYVQAVLVPEVAVRLVREDLALNAAQARDVLKESVGLGEAVNGEVDEIVIRKDVEEVEIEP